MIHLQMNSKFLGMGAIIMAIGVILGAMGAHYFKSKITPDALLVYEKAVFYLLIHGLAIILVGIIANQLSKINFDFVGYLFFTGIVLFSGSLFILAICKLQMPDILVKVIGIVTPFGGLSFILGWILLAVKVSKKV